MRERSEPSSTVSELASEPSNTGRARAIDAISPPAATRRVLRAGDGSFRLVCLPFAGGSARSFTPLARRLPPEWTVVAAEPVRGQVTDFDELVTAYLRVLADDLAAPGLLLGHSMGALAAMGIADRLGAGWPAGLGLVLSAVQPPHRVPGAATRWAALDEDTLLDTIAPLGVFPADSPDRSTMLRFVLPPFRQDVAVLATCRAPTAVPAAPTWVVFGSHDAVATPEMAVEVAAAVRARGTRAVAGEHMYVLHQAEAMAAVLTEITAEMADSDRRGLAPATSTPQESEAAA